LAAPETSHHAYGNGYFANVMSRISGWLKPQDIVTVHWYGDGPSMPGYLQYVKSFAGSRQVWLSETGWSNCNDGQQWFGIDGILNTFGPTVANKIFVYVLRSDSDCSESLVRQDWRDRAAYGRYQRTITGTATAWFYENINWCCNYFSISGDMAFVGWDWNDRISSLLIPPGRTVVLYEHANFGGASVSLTPGKHNDLRRFPGPGPGGQSQCLQRAGLSMDNRVIGLDQTGLSGPNDATLHSTGTST
jgi:hypothetical protein